jgi:filamentous hemagglutinin
LASGDASVSATQISLADAKVTSHGFAMTSTAGDIDASRASINAQGLVNASANQVLRTDNATISAGQLKLAASSLFNVFGSINQTGAAATSVSMTGSSN